MSSIKSIILTKTFLLIISGVITKTVNGQYRVNEFMRKANEAFISNQFEKAIEYCDRAIKIDITYAPAYDLRGWLKYKTGKKDEAITDITNAIKFAPRNPNYFINRGSIFVNNNNLAKAVTDFTTALSLSPGNSTVYYYRADALLNLGFYEKALSDCSECILLSPKKNDCYQLRGIINLLQFEYEKAIEDFTQSINNNIVDAWAYAARGSSYLMLGNYYAAISDLERSITLDSNLYDPYSDILTTFSHTGQFQKAREYYQKFKKRNIKKEHSPGWEFYEYYIEALTEGVLNNNFDKALNDILISERLFARAQLPEHKKREAKNGLVDVLYLKGYVLEQTGKLAEAINAYKQTLLLNKNWSDVSDAIERVKKKIAKNISVDKTPPKITLLEPSNKLRNCFA
jgi:tetratricopeptide (TPR) repeat protein